MAKNYLYYGDSLRTFNVNALIKYLFVLLINISFVSITFASQFPNEYPSFLPPGFSKEIRGKYRVIEHSPNRTIFYIHDTDKIKITKNGIKMYPPIYWQYGGKNWAHEVVNTPLETFYNKENIYLIEKGKPIQRSDPSKRIFVPGMNYPHVATDEESLDTYAKVKNSTDIKTWKPIMLELYTKRKLFQVENNVKVKILESKNGRVKIKVLGGKYKGRIGWVISDWVK